MVNTLPSPGIQVNEEDQTTSLVTGNPSVAGFAGCFNRGPMDQIVSVSNLYDLARIFGKPDATNKIDYYLARQYLLRSGGLKVVRTKTSGSKNSVAIVPNDPLTIPLIKNEIDYLNSYANGQGSAFGTFTSKTPGAWGNTLRISICPADSSAFNAWAYKSAFPKAPSTSPWAASKGGSLDEIHIVIVDVNGDIDGVPGKILKSIPFASQASDAKSLDGADNYYKNLINATDWVYWLSHPTSLTDAGSVSTNKTFTVTQSAITVTLAGGVTDNTATVTETTNAYAILINDELLGIDKIVGPRLSATIGENGFNITEATTLANNLIARVDTKRKAFLTLSPPIELTVNRDAPLQDLVTFADTLTSSSYAACDTTAVQVVDETTTENAFVYIPGSANLAGCLAYSEQAVSIASSPAGFQRGQYVGVSQLSYNPSKDDQGVLWGARLNPVVTKSGRGTYLFGDRTLVARDSAFDQIAVRRTFTYLQRVISDFAENFLFEYNDEQTRQAFKGVINPFLKNIIAGRYIDDGRVDTPISSEPNEFIGNIKIKPKDSIRYITLNFVATRTGFTFNEISS